MLFEGGIRTGRDVYKAQAYGAKCCLIGGAFLYGLAAMGAKGVSSAIEVIREGFDNTMILTGSTDVKNMSRDNRFRAPPTN